jgi:hypothetical protein
MTITMTAVTKTLSKSINRYIFNYLSGNYDCRGLGSSSSIIKSSTTLPPSCSLTHVHSLHRSTGDPKELGISQPVKLFLNALLRKTNLNEETVLSIDGKLSDVKKRFENNEQALKNPLNGRRMNRLHSYEEGGGVGDGGSVGSESINGSMISGVGNSAVRQKYGAGKNDFEMMMMVMVVIMMVVVVMMMMMVIIMMMIVVIIMMMMTMMMLY